MSGRVFMAQRTAQRRDSRQCNNRTSVTHLVSLPRKEPFPTLTLRSPIQSAFPLVSLSFGTRLLIFVFDFGRALYVRKGQVSTML